jgi:hypothetical protein
MSCVEPKECFLLINIYTLELWIKLFKILSPNWKLLKLNGQVRSVVSTGDDTSSQRHLAMPEDIFGCQHL